MFSIFHFRVKPELRLLKNHQLGGGIARVFLNLQVEKLKFTIFPQASSPRFSASGRSTCFFEIRSLHSG